MTRRAAVEGVNARGPAGWSGCRYIMFFTAFVALTACGANAEHDVSRTSATHEPSAPPLAEPDQVSSAPTQVAVTPENTAAPPTVAAPSPAAAPDCSGERLKVPLSPSQPDRLQIVPGIFVERLQQPQLDGPLDYTTPAPAPEMWDRSETPEGACVFRIHGVDGRCVSLEQSYLEFSAGSPPGSSPRIPPIRPGDYFDSQESRDGIEPGCAEAPNTHWWYLNVRDGAADFVSCDSQCRSIGEAAQLVLHPAEPSAE